MPDAARRRADLIELLQPVHLGSEAAAVMVEVHMAGRWLVAWLTAIDSVPAKMLRSKSAVCGVRGRDVARL